jgi:hypothetical protein
MKTARLQVLTTPAFRDWLRKEARQAGVSVGELVRTRCEQRVSDEEKVLGELTALLRKEVAATRATVRRDLAETKAILGELRARREARAVRGQHECIYGRRCRCAGRPEAFRRCAPCV